MHKKESQIAAQHISTLKRAGISALGLVIVSAVDFMYSFTEHLGKWG